MLIYHKDLKGLTGKVKTILDTSLSLFQNIKNNYSDGFNSEVTDIYVNGDKINPLEYDLSRQATVLDEVVIVNRQQGIVETAIILGVAIVSAIATYLLMPNPDTPDGGDSNKSSSNNTLTGQTNRARLYQAKPDIYGKMRVYPDIVNPASSEYIDNVMYVEHLFCVGVGEYDISKIKYSDTLLKDISGTSYTIYNPGDTIPQVRYQFESADIDGIEVTAQNLATEVIHSGTYSFAWIEPGSFYINTPADIDYWLNIEKPIYVNVYANANFSVSGSSPKGLYVGMLSRVVTNDPTDSEFDGENIARFDFSNLKFVSEDTGEVSPGYIKFNHVKENVLNPYVLPKIGTEIWVDLVFSNGLKGTVNLEFIYWQIDDNGDETANTRTKYSWSLTLNASDVQYRTVKITPKTGLGKYAISIERSNAGNTDLSDQVTIQKVSTVKYGYNYPVKDTLIYVKTKATTQALALKELKFNAVANRKVISYDTETQEVNYTKIASRPFADAALHTFVEMYERDPSELDLDSLYAIDAKIKGIDARLGYFDYSFDDIDVSLGERIEAICNAARVYVYRDGQKWRFARNEAKTRPSAMFNALNLVSSTDGGTVQKKSSLPSSYDGVQIEYVNSSEDNANGTDKKAYVNLRVKDGEIIDGAAFRPNKITLSGCRNYTQAMNRAQLEIRRLIYERTFVEDEVINDANFVDKGDLVLWVDTYDEAVIGGEIIKIDGNRFYVDQVLELDSSKSYRVAITDKTAYPSDWLGITAHDKQSFTADFSDAYIADNVNVQMGSIFIITETVSAEPTEFLLTQKQYSNGNYKINLTNYDKRIYEYDTAN